MSMFYFGKHYENESGCYLKSHACTKQVSLRLSENEMEIIKRLYPDKSVSFAIRSMINKCSGM